VFPHVQRLALQAGAAMAIAMLVAAPIATFVYPEYAPATLVTLVALYAVRPLANAITGPNLALLRSEFRYRTIAKIDGSTQLLGSSLMIALALGGAGAYSLVLPQLVLSMVRATAYLLNARSLRDRDLERSARVEEGATDAARSVRRDFMLGALAQYAHSFVGSIAVVLLGVFSTESEVGVYGFAMLIASQITLLFSYQVGIVMQPIFGRMSDDPVRQAESYRALLRGLASVSVPVALLQAALAEPFFVLFFEDRWLAALEVFQVVSVTQCFTFALASTLSMLKSQRRFRTYFMWQLTHIAIAAAALSLVAAPLGALATAVSELCTWAASIFIAKRLAAHALRPTILGSVRSFLAPWTTALPVAALAWLAAGLLERFGTTGAVLSLALVGPAALAAAFALMRLSDEQSFRFIATRTPVARLLAVLRVQVRP
jgi:PST family polysaccharide transporter